MENKFKEGDIIKHFKRDLLNDTDKKSNKFLYKVLAIAMHTETEEDMLVYQALYYPFKVFTRPLKMALEKTPKEKYPESIRNVLQEHRLELYIVEDENKEE